MIDFRLIAITDSKLCGDDFLSRIYHLCSAGIPAIQLREKQITSKQLLSLSKKVRDITTTFHHARLLINDRLDVALLSDADGIHSPEFGFSGRQLKNTNIIKGKSVHSLESAVTAEKEGFDYIIAGPVFKTPSKIQYGKPLGLDCLNEISSVVNIPVFAVGGIDVTNASKCIDKGAYGIAGIREFMLSNQLHKVMNYYRDLLNIQLYMHL